MKRILLPAFFLVLVVTIAVLAQQPASRPQEANAAAPTLKTEDLLKVRDLQYQQAKRMLTMRQLEQEYKALKDAVDAGQQQMEEVVRAGAKAASIDLEKWRFDPDALRFVARPAPTPSPGK